MQLNQLRQPRNCIARHQPGLTEPSPASQVPARFSPRPALDSTAFRPLHSTPRPLHCSPVRLALSLPLRSFRNRKLPRPATKPTGRARAKHGTNPRPRGFARPRPPQYRRTPTAFAASPVRLRTETVGHRRTGRPTNRPARSSAGSVRPIAVRLRPARTGRAPAALRAAAPGLRLPAMRRKNLGFALARLTPGIFPQTLLQGQRLRYLVGTEQCFPARTQHILCVRFTRPSFRTFILIRADTPHS
jgi:hypothetical protein